MQGPVVSERPNIKRSANKSKHLSPSRTTELVQQVLPPVTPSSNNSLDGLTKFKAIRPKPEIQYQTVLVKSPNNAQPKASVKSPRVQTEEQIKSQVIVENFFKEQKMKIERGEYSLSQPRLQSKVFMYRVSINLL